MFRYIKAEQLNNKTFIFRGQSNNKYQSNYSQKHKTRFKSRFYAYELFDGIQLFGNIAAYELLPSAKIWHYDSSVEDFVEEYQLADYEVSELYDVYGIKSLSEIDEYGGYRQFDYHDLYHSRQLVAIAYLEDHMANQYDGIGWYECFDDPSDQVMIWNDSALRRLSYQETKSLLQSIEQMHEKLGIVDSMYTKRYDGNYVYNIARR